MVKKVIQGDYHPTSASVGVTGAAQGVGASGATVSLAPDYHVYKIREGGVGEIDETQDPLKQITYLLLHLLILVVLGINIQLS